MPGWLLERERELDALDSELETVLRTRRGRLVLIGGEAGIGKSELVAAFCARVSQPRSSASAAVRLVSGACDALDTPRPAGAIHRRAGSWPRSPEPRRRRRGGCRRFRRWCSPPIVSSCCAPIACRSCSASGKVGTLCIYEASSPEAIREHAARAALPVDEIVAIADTVVVRSDPTPQPA